MKKFVFSLEALLNVKKIKKKKLEKDVAIIANKLDEEQVLLSKIKFEKLSVQEKIEELSVQGSKVFDLMEYGSYFKLITEKMKEQIGKCNKIKKELESKRAELVDMHNQIDMLERLKQEQYKEYVYELQKTDEKVLEDIVNFKLTTRSEQIYG